MPKVCIIPTGDRSGQANLIHHYSKIGFAVYLPIHGSAGLDWHQIATWPALLCQSLEQPNKRNLDIHGFDRKEGLKTKYSFINRFAAKGDLFGEDRFLGEEDWQNLYQDTQTKCQLVDFEKEKVAIDIFHTLRGSDTLFKQSMDFAKKYFPKARWITSTIFSDHHLANNLDFENVCKMMPANYVDLYKDKNSFDCYPSGFEFELLGVPTNNEASKRKGFASFNHNFRKRYPKDYALLKAINEILKEKGMVIPNYGGNVAGQGADKKYSQGGLMGGELSTLDIKEAAALTANLKGVLVLKRADYGGGTIWYALMAGTPIITHKEYVRATRSEKILKHGYNAVILDEDPKLFAKEIWRIENDKDYNQQLMNGMQETLISLITPEYWSSFRQFANKALESKVA